MDNEYGEQNQSPGHGGQGGPPQYQYQPPPAPQSGAQYGPPADPRRDVDSIDQTQTMPAALEELPPYGQSAFAGAAPQPPQPPATPVPPAYGQTNSYQGSAPDPYGAPPSAGGYDQTAPSYAAPPYPGQAQPGQPYQQPSYPNDDQNTSTYPPVGRDRPPVPMPPAGYQPTQAYPPAGGGYDQPQYDQPQYGQPQYGQPQYGQNGGYGQPDPYGNAAPAYPTQEYGNYQAPYGGQQAPDPAYGYQAAGDQYRQPADQPQYGGPTDTANTSRSASRAAQPRKSHIGLWTLLVVAVVVVVVVVATFLIKPSFLFKKVLDHSAVEQTIESQSKGSATPLTDVSCPANEKVKAGVSFQCTAAGNKKVNVTIKDSKANYEWSLAS